jgi:glycosyltransferase involved in cell wall biosynthesis
MACIKSALAIDHDDFQVILSDNSTVGDDRTKRAVKRIKDSRFIYKRRAGTPAIEHANLVIMEATSRFFVMFHDDDLFLPTYLKFTLHAMSLKEDAVAVGVNHFVMFGNKKTSLTWSDDSNAHVLWTDHRALLLRMANNGFHVKIGGFAMLGGYLYRREAVKNLRVHRELGGKYTDLSWLTEVNKLGPVMWVMKPQMHYRQHLGQDGNEVDLHDALSLLTYIKRTCGLSDGSRIIQDLRKAMLRDWAGSLVKFTTRKVLHDVFANMREHIVIFPCGQYTRRLLSVLEGVIPYEQITLIDDDPNSVKGLGKWSQSFRCSKNTDKFRCDHRAFLSSDNTMISKGLKARADALFGKRWKDVRSIPASVNVLAKELELLVERKP